MKRPEWCVAKGDREMDGVAYRWLARGSRNQGYMVVTIQQDTAVRPVVRPVEQRHDRQHKAKKKPGAPVRITVRGNVLWDFPFAHSCGALVAGLIMAARQAGWEPTRSGKTLIMDLTYDGPMDGPAGPLERLEWTVKQLERREGAKP